MGVSILEGSKAARIATALESLASSSSSSEAKADQALSEVAAARTRITALENQDATDLGAVSFSEAQSLTTAQKTQARANIGLSDIDSLTTGNVKYNTAQSLTTAQQAQARSNIGAVSASEIPPGDNVQYVPQNLTAEQKAQARTNIGAVSASEIPSGDNVQFVPQTLTGEQKAQARTNIAAASASEVSGMSDAISDLNDSLNNFGNFVRDITETGGGFTVTYDEGQPKTIDTGLVFDGGYVGENNYLYLTKNNVELSQDVYAPILMPKGGGGGSGSIALSNVTKPSTIRNGGPAIYRFTATSTDAMSITARWSINGKVVGTTSGDSGDVFEFDFQNYTKDSFANKVKVELESSGGASFSPSWTLNTIAFSIEWGETINSIMLNNSNTNMSVPIIVSAEPTSNNNVTVTVNQESLPVKNVTGSQRFTVQINKAKFQAGVNTITARMVSSTDENDAAPEISFKVIWGTGVISPVAVFAENQITCNQYDTVNINYFVFDPDNEIASCTLQIGSEEPRLISVNRTVQTLEYTPMSDGTVTLTLTCGTASATAQLVVSEVKYNLSYYSDDSLQYVLDPSGHSNTDSDRASFGNLTLSTNFDWENGGFKQDEDGATAFVVTKGNTATLPRCLFEDSDVNGKTIELSFRIKNSDQYDAVAMQELDNGGVKGIILRANNGEIRLNNNVGQGFKYCEDTRIDFSILVESNVEQRLVTLWMDGIPSSAYKYITASTLTQNQNRLVIGSAHCDVWVYAIRVYDSELTKKNMIQNYVSLGSTTDVKIRRYQVNTILNNSDQITVEALHRAMSDLTIVEIRASRMTTSKEDNVPADITITDGSTVLELPAASGPDTKDGTVFKVQGTSSAAYGRSSYNLDIDFTGTDKTYKISENAIPVNYINIKVNVASSENANNVNAVDWYNSHQPYITEPRQRPGVRDSIEGKPCAVFITNTSDEPVWFSSLYIQPNETVLYAMGDLCNSKKNKAVFGQDGSGEHPTKACIEVSGNDTGPQRFISATARFNSEADDGDGLWEGWNEQTQTFDGIKHYEWRMKPKSADKTAVIESWDALVAWVVSTIGNSAKFKDEVGDYFAINSLLYHFLFIEYFACYDNVSKNTFYSYDWDETAQKYLWNIKAAYDMDTILAADNDGKPYGDYGIDYGDTVNNLPNGSHYFNADVNPIWTNIKEAYHTELSNMYISLRSSGAWNSRNILDKWNNYQSRRPHAAMVLDAYNKYIEPYKTRGMILDNEVKGYDDSYLPRLQGSKTYWRKQFLTYQTACMDGKYGYANKSAATLFRTNGVAGVRDYSIKVYAKTYVTMMTDNNIVDTKKIETGQEVIFTNVSVGNNTTLYVTPDNLVQYIRPLNDTQISAFSASGAAKLMEAILGGDDENVSWDNSSGISAPSTVLKDFSIRNISNFAQPLDMSSNVGLETLDTRNTNTGFVILPSFAPVTSVQLNACTGIFAHNLLNVQTFTIANGANLVSIVMENCNNVVSSAIASAITQAAASVTEATRRIRATDVNWSFGNLDALTKIATTWNGYNALGEEQDKPVITGTVNVATLSKKKLELIHNALGSGNYEDYLDENNNTYSYGGLTINYSSIIQFFTVSFVNMDGQPIQDKSGNNYVQYIDYLGTAYDPIEANEVNTPTYTDPNGQYYYTFTGWDNLDGAVSQNKTVTATYSSSVITYTVRWFDKPNGTLYDSRQVPYGGEAVYDPNGTIGFPTLTDEEPASVYKLFTGWDKPTGFVTGDIDVYGQWERALLPNVGVKSLDQMSAAEIYGVAKSGQASSYWEAQDHIDIPVGTDFNFDSLSVNSEVLLQNEYFDGTRIVRKDGVHLFSTDAPSFTMAIEYEFTGVPQNSSYPTLVSCYDDNGKEGFKLSLLMSNGDPTISVDWGDKGNVVSHGYNKGIVVIRHRKGSKYLYITSDNSGRQIYHQYNSSGNAEVANRRGYDGYSLNILELESVRTQVTETNAALCFGGVPLDSGYLQRYAGQGWIHWCKIWYTDLGRDSAVKLANWPHETWRMQYRGNTLYNLDGGGLDKASFVANTPLSQYFDYYDSASETPTGGWLNSPLRTFVNNRCFKALPIAWQGIIKSTILTTKASSGGSSTTQETRDKIYIPAYVDLSSIEDSAFTIEGAWIPWLNSNRSRMRFMGISIPFTAQIFADMGDDPASHTETIVVHEGDIWIPNSSCAYMYISATTAAKHNYICGRPISDPANTNAANGGKWIRSNSYWTRTPARSDERHNVVGASGEIYAMYAGINDNRNHGIMIAFSL